MTHTRRGRHSYGVAAAACVLLTLAGCGTNAGPESAEPAADVSVDDAAEAAADASVDAGVGVGVETTDESTDDDGEARIEVLEPETNPNAPPVATTEGAAGDPASRYTVVAQATNPSITARVAPDPDAEPVAEFANPTPTGSPLVFRSVDSEAASPDWLEVQLPVQPNGTTGWVPRSDVSLSDNPYRVEITRAEFTLRVYHLNELWMETPIAVGTGDTPTPVGDFYLLELLSPPDPNGPYGPFAFGLSGFSEVFDSFGGADTAIIGLHGTNDPASLCSNVSHGCIRLEIQVIEQSASVLPLGTPVLIT